MSSKNIEICDMCGQPETECQRKSNAFHRCHTYNDVEPNFALLSSQFPKEVGLTDAEAASRTGNCAQALGIAL